MWVRLVLVGCLLLSEGRVVFDMFSLPKVHGRLPACAGRGDEQKKQMKKRQPRFPGDAYLSVSQRALRSLQRRPRLAEASGELSPGSTGLVIASRAKTA